MNGRGPQYNFCVSCGCVELMDQERFLSVMQNVRLHLSIHRNTGSGLFATQCYG